jgi:hypothetical protein
MPVTNDSTGGGWGQISGMGFWPKACGANDTPGRLAKAYSGDGQKLTVIRLFNGLNDADVILNGQVLAVPAPTLWVISPTSASQSGACRRRPTSQQATACCRIGLNTIA